MKIAHVEASNVLPPIAATGLYKNIPKKAAAKAPKMTYLGTFPKKIEVDFKKILKV